MSDQLLLQILEKLNTMESDIKSELSIINSKLDSITTQVAQNTEQDTDLVTKVATLDTDMKIIKKLLTNQ